MTERVVIQIRLENKEQHQMAKELAKHKKVSVSKMVRDWIDQGAKRVEKAAR